MHQLKVITLSGNSMVQIHPKPYLCVVCMIHGGVKEQVIQLIGMAIVLGIAKYFMENQIKPHYTMKFIGFCGEEAGMRGSIYYEALHRHENIIDVIDLNQLGFTQNDPRLTLEVAANNRSFLDEIWKVVQRTDYINRTGNVTDIVPVYMENGHISDDRSFASKRSNSSCKTVCFLKNGSWLMHHRDGLNHTVGDVIDYFNWTDVSATGDMILNVTMFLTDANTPSESLQETSLSQQIISLFHPVFCTSLPGELRR